MMDGGAPPPLSPGGAGWARLVEGYLAASESVGPDRKAASFYREAVGKLSGGGPGGQCISQQLAKRALAQVPAAR